MQNPVTVLQSDKALEERYLQSRVPLVAGALAALGLIGSLIVAGYGWDTPVPKEGPWPRIKTLEAIIVVGWLVLPPVYFWYEYFMSTEGRGMLRPERTSSRSSTARMWPQRSGSLLSPPYWRFISGRILGWVRAGANVSPRAEPLGRKKPIG